jgi:RimJ/RimL family protein N-acetyltransferase
MLEQHSPASDALVDSPLRMTILCPEHEAALVELFEANDVPEVTRFFDPFPLTEATAKRLVRYAGRDRYWGVWVDEQLAGLVMVRGWDGGHPQPTLGAMIDSRFRGAGLLSRAADMVVEELSAMGEPVLRAKFHEDNWASARVIFRRGLWKVVSRGNGRIVVERAVPPV